MKLIQYNKVALQQYQKDLQIRLAALPVIRSKESALRNEVKLQQQALRGLENLLREKTAEAAALGALWQHWQLEFLQLQHIQIKSHNFAGVKFQRYVGLELANCALQQGVHPAWLFDAWQLLKELLVVQVQTRLKTSELELLEAERKRTTQKLNLFEKVQIPHYEEAIRKIKRFLEDEETLIKATQKIVKKKKEAAA
jgi:V/A-type H+/Na+-transporting ATPase subunit D